MLVMLPRVMVEPPRERPHQTFDFAGASLFGVGIAALLFALSESYRLGWTSPAVAGGLALAMVCAVLFVAAERRVPQPMIDLRMFASPTFSAGNAAKVCGYFPFAANNFLLPFYLVRALELPPAAAGAFLTPLPIGIGTFIAPNDSAILGATPPGRLGVANGIMGVSRTLGLLLGTSAAATLLSARLVANANAFLPSFHQPYWVITTVAALGIYFAAVRD